MPKLTVAISEEWDYKAFFLCTKYLCTYSFIMTMYLKNQLTKLHLLSNTSYYACSYTCAGEHKYQMIESGYLWKGMCLGCVDRCSSAIAGPPCLWCRIHGVNQPSIARYYNMYLLTEVHI